MIRFKCPKCSKTLQVGPEQSGKTIQCPCGTKIKAPSGQGAGQASGQGAGRPTAAAQGTTSQPAAAQRAVADSGTTTTACPSCQQKLRVPVSAAGKMLKCKCGSAFRAPGGSAAPAPVPQPVAAANPYAAPAVKAPAGSQSLGGAEQPPYDDPWSDLESNSSPSAVFHAGQGKQAAKAKPNSHLASARQELGGEVGGGDDGGSGMAAILSGIVMMVVAVVWFVGALMAGWIFFYPPVLFVLGLISVIKGVLGRA